MPSRSNPRSLYAASVNEMNLQSTENASKFWKGAFLKLMEMLTCRNPCCNGENHTKMEKTVPLKSSMLLVQVVRGGQVPPPSTVGCSCVYIVRRGDGRFYCGQTDELKGRLNRHRSKAGKVRGGGRMEAAYLVVPSSEHGQSTAKVVEAQAIQVPPPPFHLPFPIPLPKMSPFPSPSQSWGECKISLQSVCL